MLRNFSLRRPARGNEFRRVSCHRPRAAVNRFCSDTHRTAIREVATGPAEPVVAGTLGVTRESNCVLIARFACLCDYIWRFHWKARLHCIWTWPIQQESSRTKIVILTFAQMVVWAQRFVHLHQRLATYYFLQVLPALWKQECKSFTSFLSQFRRWNARTDPPPPTLSITLWP